MKAIPLKAAVLLVALAASSCMTTYDAHGQPVQTVDPGAAAAIALGAAAVGYAIGENNDRHYYHGPYYGPPCW